MACRKNSQSEGYPPPQGQRLMHKGNNVNSKKVKIDENKCLLLIKDEV